MGGINSVLKPITIERAAHRARRAVRDLVRAGETFAGQQRRLGGLNIEQLATWCEANGVDAGPDLIHAATYFYKLSQGEIK